MNWFNWAFSMRVYVYLNNRYAVFVCLYVCVCVHTVFTVCRYCRCLTFQFLCCFSSVTNSCLTLSDPMDYSMPDFPALHSLLKYAQTHIHSVGEAMQPSHPLSPCSPALNLSQHQVDRLLGFSFSMSPSIEYSGWFPLTLTGLTFLLSKEFSRVFSCTRVWKH